MHFRSPWGLCLVGGMARWAVLVMVQVKEACVRGAIDLMQLVCSKDLSGTPYMPGHMGGLGATRRKQTSFSDVMGTDLPHW